MLYVRRNEHTNRVKVVTVVQDESEIPERLRDNLEILDEAYPEIKIDFAVVKDTQRPWLIFLCGHYEGVDERVRLRLADEELSVGDYVLTCGELPAMVLIDSVVRLVPGSLGDLGSTVEESFCGNLLEYPHYTRPAEYRGMRVPQVLVCGDFSRVSRWRKLQAHRRTKQRRPDLIYGSSNSSH